VRKYDPAADRTIRKSATEFVNATGPNVETVPALVLASYRDDELDRGHPLRVALGELATAEATGRLKVAPLSAAAVAMLAKPLGVDAEELYRKTSGNPFFVTEALAAGADEIPHTVRDAVRVRAARLSPGAGTLLDAVAVVPPQAELWLLESLADDALDTRRSTRRSRRRCSTCRSARSQTTTSRKCCPNEICCGS
jgi:hypothetical protein